MKIFGYIRVSSKDQKEDRQIKKMIDKGINERDLFIDKVSGKNFERPSYQLLKQMVREGDTVVFDSITRMGRNMNDTMKEYEWFVENGINLCFIEEPMINTNNNSDDVMKQAIQKIILTMLTAFAEKERKEIKIRQAEGIAVAKEQGVKFGRPSMKIPNNWDKNYKEWKSGNITAQKFAQNVDMSIATFYRKLKQYEKDKKEKVC
ncbi:recombinase family protein [Bacillus cereus]|nr:recombinase family protein [Bacillus cereus]SMD59511.1 Putative transposon Tn552 DNA-invertase bin3 [Bacillus cereus]HDR8089628.1 recombinase family protein [Bacillus cereus]HDX9524570.1 recombinase family protein [Bacillus cereus]HDX9586670.1 recombinase family protein [Bacillus cereus]HDX9608638.1 recombinase family protein [Bacillus cereus]